MNRRSWCAVSWRVNPSISIERLVIRNDTFLTFYGNLGNAITIDDDDDEQL